jgi:hypothetical protein
MVRGVKMSEIYREITVQFGKLYALEESLGIIISALFQFP